MTPEDQLDGQTPQQLIAEIRELSEQYRREVSTARRTWPKSIRERVLALYRLGINCFRIARLTGVPEPTVTSWCKPRRPLRRTRAKNDSRGQFLEVIRDSQIPTVGTGDPPIQADLGVLEVVVSFPSGLTIRGLKTADLIELCRCLGVRP